MSENEHFYSNFPKGRPKTLKKVESMCKLRLLNWFSNKVMYYLKTNDWKGVKSTLLTSLESKYYFSSNHSFRKSLVND